MLRKASIHVKFSLVFLVTVGLIATALLAGLYQLRAEVLRNEAQAVANQVVSFRSWVAKTGMVWVDNLSDDFHDFLASRSGEGGKTFYGKNPALATRELSTIVNASGKRATFRVTSDEYRNPANRPDLFESSAISRFKQEPELSYFEDFVGDNYRYAQPIFVTEACLKCHGKKEDAPREVIEKYGSEKAFGYKVGDVRGIIGVGLPNITLVSILPSLANPITIGLFLLAFVVSYLYVERGVIRRIRNLTRSAEAIAEGDLDAELETPDTKNNRNEIDHVYNAVNLLRNSLRVAMRRMQRR